MVYVRRANIVSMVLGLAAFASFVDLTRAASNAATCHLMNGKSAAPDIAVTVKADAPQVRTGDLIPVEWKVNSKIDLSCRTPLYLMLSTPMRTRFEGKHFYALPPSAPAPFGIKKNLNHTRVLIPLHLGPEMMNGTFSVKVYETGPFLMDWAVLEVPKLIANPTTAKDFTKGEERATETKSIGGEISVIGGNPHIVVRDHFAIAAPKKIIQSNSGEFELQVFSDFYRVLDRKTRELVMERGGQGPNFSPSSRFIGAFADGPGFEILDLYSGEVVTSRGALNTDSGFRGSVHLAAWSPGDTFVSLSFWGWAGIELRQSLIDGPQHSFPDTGCHGCQGFGSALRIDLEAGYVSYRGQSSGWENLLDSIGSNEASRNAELKYPYTDSNSQEESEKRDALEATLNKQLLGTLADAAFFDPNGVLPPDDEERPAGDWRLGGPLRLSHHCIPVSDACSAHTSDDREWSLELAQLVKARVDHTGPVQAVAAAIGAEAADKRLVEVRKAAARDTKQTRAAIKKPEHDRALIWQRLQQLQLQINGGATIYPSVNEYTYEDKPKKVLGPILKSLPSASKIMPIIDTEKTDYDDSGPFGGIKDEATLVWTNWIEATSTWSHKNQTYWLIKSYYSMGASSRHFLYLLHGTDSGTPKLVDLASRLKFRVGSKPNGLDDAGDLEITDERGSTMGFGGWPGSVDKVTVAFDRYLLTTGLWTGAGRRWVLLFDLATDQIIFFNRDIPDAPTFAEFGVTEDGRTVVQSHSNGQLHFWDVASGQIILRGHDIDDELVVYDSHGYYASSPEGAQLIFLKFPGLPGYNSLQQFAKTLNRPDVIKAVLAGQGTSPDPRLTPPPGIALKVTQTNDPAKRNAKLQILATSAVGLQKFRAFVDGRLVTEFDATGSSANSEHDIPLLPESRWVTAVAVDKSGYESVPVGQSLTGATAAVSSRLIAIAIGTDNYDDSKIRKLNAAKIDAANFSMSAGAAKGRGLYADVVIHSFLDAPNLRTDFLTKLSEVIADAGENDTIMLFAAGHGFRDEAAGQFYLATRDSKLDNLRLTSIAWNDIATELDKSKARVIVFLDACHSGAARSGGSNDEAVSALLNRKASITVIAAAKGRQESLEFNGGGVFTSALVAALGPNRKSADTNGNGSIELAELYGAIKRSVVGRTSGRQTPWIARNLMVGETPLF